MIQSPTGGREWIESQDSLFPDGLVYRCLGSTFVIHSIPCASVCGPSAYIVHFFFSSGLYRHIFGQEKTFNNTENLV